MHKKVEFILPKLELEVFINAIPNDDIEKILFAISCKMQSISSPFCK